MKTKAVLCLALMFVLGCDLAEAPEIKFCTKPGSPFWCANNKVCCALPFTDGKSCYPSAADCAKSGNTCEECKLESTGSQSTGGKFDGTYSGNFISSTPCGFPPCTASKGSISFGITSGKVTNGGALQGTVDNNGIFTGTWSTGVSSPFSMKLHSSSPSFSSSTIKIVGPTQDGAAEQGESRLGATVTVKKN